MYFQLNSFLLIAVGLGFCSGQQYSQLGQNGLNGANAYGSSSLGYSPSSTFGTAGQSGYNSNLGYNSYNGQQSLGTGSFGAGSNPSLYSNQQYPNSFSGTGYNNGLNSLTGTGYNSNGLYSAGSGYNTGYYTPTGQSQYNPQGNFQTSQFGFGQQGYSNPSTYNPYLTQNGLAGQQSFGTGLSNNYNTGLGYNNGGLGGTSQYGGSLTAPFGAYGSGTNSLSGQYSSSFGQPGFNTAYSTGSGYGATALSGAGSSSSYGRK